MSDDQAVTLSVLLWARPGAVDLLAEYEDQVLGLLADHGGAVLYRARSREGPEQPTEVHLIRFRSEQGFQAFMDDGRRTALADRRDRAIARTEVIRVDVVERQ